MKCPVLSAGIIASSHEAVEPPYDCLKEECPWWDKSFECCDPTGLAHTLERLTDELAELVRKMPPRGKS